MKLKKIASLALAGVMALTMLAGCADGAPIDDNTTNPDDNGTVVAAGYSKTFEDTLSEYADRRISMSDNAELTAKLNTAIGNVSSSLMTEFHKINMDVVDLLDYQFSDRAVAWMIDDLGGANVVMSQSDAFRALVPDPADLIDDENLDKTVIMLFAVDNAVDENAAVKQVAKNLDASIRLLNNDNDTTGDINCGVDHTTLHYTYTGSVSVASKNWVDVTTVGMHFVAVQINRIAA